MTVDDSIELDNPTGCPVTHYHEVNQEVRPAGWHFDNFDVKREMAPVHTGFAGAPDNQYFLITRMADIRNSFQSADTFSNSSVVPADPQPLYRWIPEMLDGRIHTAWRQLLGPFFTPAAVANMESLVRRRFMEVLDSVVRRGECDFVHDVALLYPNVIFMDLFGLPREDAEQFQAWEVAILHGGHSSEEGNQHRMDAMIAVMGYFSGLIKDRRENADPSRTDILSKSLDFHIDGESVSDQDLLDFCLLMFMAGLDTVAAQLTFSFWHLATHDDDRERIVSDPSLIPTAVEEFLRYYSFVTPGRKVVHDTEIAGCPIKAGQMVYLPLVSANRDPREFDRAGDVLIDRATNRHIAFGAGPHRCLGSHLARQELRIAMEEWHARIPSYRVAPGAEIVEHGGQIGISNLPLVWDVS
jgi:cytochrome P450